jgi:RNA polymerase sigma factor (sigma-70 family)
MYRQSPAPPEWDLQKYIEESARTKDKTYLGWFLHHYENTINLRAESYMIKYAMQEHFADIKQSIVVGIYKAAERFDPGKKKTFIAYAQRIIDREVFNYIRAMRTGYSVQSEREYSLLRKAMALYHEYGDKSDNDTIKKIADQLGVSPDRTITMLTGGLRNEHMVDVYDESGDEQSQLFSDSTSEPCALTMKEALYERLYEAYFSLDFTERMMLAQHLGFCPECLSIYGTDKNDLDEHNCPKKKHIKPLPYTDIATSHGLSDASTVKRGCTKALNKLRKDIKDD